MIEFSGNLERQMKKFLMVKCFSVFFPFDKVLDTLPTVRYQETMSTILTWIQQSETKLSIPQVTVTEYEIMQQRLGELQVCDFVNLDTSLKSCSSIKQSHCYNLNTILELK